MDKVRLPGTWAIEAFQRGGVDIEALTESLPEEVNTLLYEMSTMPPESVNRLLTKCAELSNDQDFGLTMNERVDTSMFGVFGYLLLNSGTVEDLLGYIERYYTIFYSSGVFFTINTLEETINIQFHVDHSDTFNTRHQSEWSLGFLPYYLTPILGNAGKPISANFRHSAPNDLQKLKSIFGHGLHFNQPENKLVYQKSILKCSLSETSPSLLKVLRQEADEILQARYDCETMEKKVRILLIESLEKNKATASDIARELNMTLSTFKRRLLEEKIVYKQLKEAVKNGLAVKLLLSTEASLFEIAKKLGFADQTSFSRFFVRCNETTPHRYREKNQRDEQLK